MSEKYYVISRCEDDLHFNTFNHAAMLKFIEENADDHTFLDKFSDTLDRFPSWSALVIKGVIVQPQPVKKVTEWKI